MLQGVRSTSFSGSWGGGTICLKILCILFEYLTQQQKKVSFLLKSPSKNLQSKHERFRHSICNLANTARRGQPHSYCHFQKMWKFLEMSFEVEYSSLFACVSMCSSLNWGLPHTSWFMIRNIHFIGIKSYDCPLSNPWMSSEFGFDWQK